MRTTGRCWRRLARTGWWCRAEFANKLAQSLATSNVLEYIELSADYGISEFEAPAA